MAQNIKKDGSSKAKASSHGQKKEPNSPTIQERIRQNSAKKKSDD